MKTFVYMCMVLFWVPCLSYCQGTGNCTDALVAATYNRLDVSNTDWRIATLVTENEWDSISHSAGASATIYGIPVGVSYKDFHDRVTQKVNSYNESLTQSELTNVAWTGLAAGSSQDYITCVTASQQGIQMYVNLATKDEVSVRVRWNPTGNEPKWATPTWTWNSGVKRPLPVRLSSGYTSITLPRPAQSHILQANFQGHDASLVITPYPATPTPAQISYIPCVETYVSRVADGWGIYWSPPVTFCTPQKPDGWTITRLLSFTTYDDGTGRNCNYYGQCTGAETDSQTRICRSITVQGHNDGSHEGHGKLQGSMIVEWRQPVRAGEDPTASCHSGQPINVAHDPRATLNSNGD